MTGPSANNEIIILAAGKGTRMYSKRPKVLHCIADKPLLMHTIECAQQISSKPIHIVYGHGGEQVREVVSTKGMNWVEQAEQLGTGHAVQQAIDHLSDESVALVMYADVPLIQAETLATLIKRAANECLALLTVNLAQPDGYGRVLRNTKGEVTQIVEQKDANKEQLDISEINTGFIAVSAKRLKKWLQQLNNNNAQGEYYLTDIIEMAVTDKVNINTVHPDYDWEVQGVNTMQQLAELERVYQLNQANRFMQQGLTLYDPARFDLRGELILGSDVAIDINVVLLGRIELGDGVYIGPNNVIKDCHIGANTEVLANCVLEQSQIGSRCRLGPFTRIRPETHVGNQVHLGNFVELKKSQVSDNSKINHLSYVGDTQVGSRVNIGAGTIVCNYDGANKHQSIIEDEVFIGSDSQLISPVTIGRGATIGAGSTITHDVPADELTLSRVKQKTKKGWKRPVKKSKQTSA